MRLKDEDTGKYVVPCRSCIGGRLITECCNGSGGCDCRGQEMDMGACRVCNGGGWCHEDADTSANLRAIRGMIHSGGYLGSGPGR